MKNFNEKRIVITGASSGLGAEFAKQLSKYSTDLVLIARREQKLIDLKSELLALGARTVELIVADLSKQNELLQVAEQINLKPIDLLINNAGRGSFGYFQELSWEQELEQINLNIVASTFLLHSVLKQMKSRKRGAIISVSSIAAFQPIPFMATYAATKVYNFFHSLAVREELKVYNISLLVLCPGPTATEFGGVARVPGTITGGHRDSVEMVVSQALSALQRNQSFVVTGFRSKLLSLGSRFLPKTLSVYFLAKGLKKSLQGIK